MEKIKQCIDMYCLKEFDRGDIDTLREGFSEAQFSLVVLGIIFRFIGIPFSRLVLNRKVRDRTLGREGES